MPLGPEDELAGQLQRYVSKGGHGHHRPPAWTDVELYRLLRRMRSLRDRTPDQESLLQFLEEACAERRRRSADAS